MTRQLLYVELKSGFSDNGPAWIGRGKFTRSRSTLYFNGLALRKAQDAGSNYSEVETADFYWVSGVKKNGMDRHQFGSGKILIDESIVGEYLAFRGLKKLPTHGYEVVCLNNVPAKQQLHAIENSSI